MNWEGAALGLLGFCLRPGFQRRCSSRMQNPHTWGQSPWDPRGRLQEAALTSLLVLSPPPAPPGPSPGVDRRWDPDILLLRHLPGGHDLAGELQQVPIQLLQASVGPQAWRALEVTMFKQKKKEVRERGFLVL